MQPHIFKPESINYVKKKAKQLQRAFPGLKLSLAQNTTAVALGFSDWFDCNKRLEANNEHPSIYDEDLQESDRLMRRHYQFCSLVDKGKIAAFDAERFVRYWGLTTRTSASLLRSFDTPYTEMSKLLERYQASPDAWDVLNIKAEPILPKRLGDGVLLSGFPSLKYTYYILDIEPLAKIPLGVRGNSSMFLDFENGRLLSSFQLGFPNTRTQKDLDYIAEHLPIQFEWITGESSKSNYWRLPSINQLIEESLAHKDSWYALSIRSDLKALNAKPDQFYVSALRGEAFAEMLRTKGEMHFNEVKWFKLDRQKYRPLDPIFNFGLGLFEINELRSAIHLNPEWITPCDPLFHSPFKFGPMQMEEYKAGIESGGLMFTDEIEQDESTGIMIS